MNLLCFTSDTISGKKNSYVQRVSAHEFSVAHYTGKVTYDVRFMSEKNRDFLPPEMVFQSIFVFFTNIYIILYLSKGGNIKIVQQSNCEDFVLECALKNW